MTGRPCSAPRLRGKGRKFCSRVTKSSVFPVTFHARVRCSRGGFIGTNGTEALVRRRIQTQTNAALPLNGGLNALPAAFYTGNIWQQLLQTTTVADGARRLLWSERVAVCRGGVSLLLTHMWNPGEWTPLETALRAVRNLTHARLPSHPAAVGRPLGRRHASPSLLQRRARGRGAGTHFTLF